MGLSIGIKALPQSAKSAKLKACLNRFESRRSEVMFAIYFIIHSKDDSL